MTVASDATEEAGLPRLVIVNIAGNEESPPIQAVPSETWFNVTRNLLDPSSFGKFARTCRTFRAVSLNDKSLSADTAALKLQHLLSTERNGAQSDQQQRPIGVTLIKLAIKHLRQQVEEKGDGASKQKLRNVLITLRYERVQATRLYSSEQFYKNEIALLAPTTPTTPSGMPPGIHV